MVRGWAIPLPEIYENWAKDSMQDKEQAKVYFGPARKSFLSDKAGAGGRSDCLWIRYTVSVAQ